jgi:hypothetical protein
VRPSTRTLPGLGQPIESPSVVGDHQEGGEMDIPPTVDPILASFEKRTISLVTP